MEFKKKEIADAILESMREEVSQFVEQEFPFPWSAQAWSDKPAPQGRASL